MSKKIQHFLHRHLLWLLWVSQDDQLGCRGCCKRITGSIYVCFGCDFYLHRSCNELPREIRNFFHPCHLLLTILDYEYICNACFKTGSGLSNRCERCEFDMHGAPYGKLCFASAFDSFAYGCQDCNFFFHHSCMINIPRQIIHFFHPSCPLVLLADVPCQCEGCDEASSGLAFLCGKCKFQLDVKCALLPTVESKDADKIQHSAHEHPPASHESKEFGTEVRCRACGEHCLLAPCFGCSKRSCAFFLHRKRVV
ncbi:hypothetical protein ES288_A08G197300v1, partial [Gossypium darwinii]